MSKIWVPVFALAAATVIACDYFDPNNFEKPMDPKKARKPLAGLWVVDLAGLQVQEAIPLYVGVPR